MPKEFKGPEGTDSPQEEISQELLDLCKGNREAAKNVQAVREKYGDNKWWESSDPFELAWGQLNEKIQIIESNKFHKAIEEALGRTVNTYEFGDPELLKKEMQGKRPAQTLVETIKTIPKEKRVIIESPEKSK
jgi:hypothetical protein